MELESLHRLEANGLEMVIAIDSTVLGPSLGGCRWRPYPDSASARREATALARAMTRKAALARLPLGGGKAVVSGDPKQRTREDLLAFADLVESLGGRYVTAADMGTGEPEMAVISEGTRHVVGLPVALGGCGDPSPYTARGVHIAIEAALRHLGRGLDDAVVAVQGVGQVGRALVQLLIDSGARVRVADSRPCALEELPPEVAIVDPGRILLEPCDVLAPCGPPHVVDGEMVEALACRVLCGAANNPLSELAIGRRLAERDILYVPDFLANAGGLIHLAVALERGGPDDLTERLRVIPRNLGQVLAYACAERVDPATAAERIALDLVESRRHD